MNMAAAPMPSTATPCIFRILSITACTASQGDGARRSVQHRRQYALCRLRGRPRPRAPDHGARTASGRRPCPSRQHPGGGRLRRHRNGIGAGPRFLCGAAPVAGRPAAGLDHLGPSAPAMAGHRTVAGRGSGPTAAWARRAWWPAARRNRFASRNGRLPACCISCRTAAAGGICTACTAASVEALCPMEAEFATPHWTFGGSLYGFVSDDELICTYIVQGVSHLGRLTVGAAKLEALPHPVPGNPRTARRPRLCRPAGRQPHHRAGTGAHRPVEQ